MFSLQASSFSIFELQKSFKLPRASRFTYLTTIKTILYVYCNTVTTTVTISFLHTVQYGVTCYVRMYRTVRYVRMYRRIYRMIGSTVRMIHTYHIMTAAAVRTAPYDLQTVGDLSYLRTCVSSFQSSERPGLHQLDLVQRGLALTAVAVKTPIRLEFQHA